jgi:hypothetical protein
VRDVPVQDVKSPEQPQLRLVIQEPKEPPRSQVLFEQFWKAYPRKTGKKKALEAFKKLNPTEPLLYAMLAAITKQKTWPDWIRDEGRYIPYPTTWLNQGRWMDEEFKPLKAERKFVG